MEVVTTFATLSGFWRQRLAEGLYSVVISGVAKWLAKFEKDEKAIHLIERMGVFLAEMNGSLVSRVNATSEKTNQKGDDGPKDGVVLTTMHASKGLEFDRVWVIGCNDNIIPSPKSGNLAEERRLLYVAVTRAKKVLHLSATTEAKVSPLLTEAGVMFNTTL
jgi:superfamily I DNA/RNA helicase